jgi:tRNA-dihydrouridine synthase B
MYKGEADWSLIAEVKNNPRMTDPDLRQRRHRLAQKALEYRNRYGVDGIMIGRASIGYPWIFNEIKHYMATGELLVRGDGSPGRIIGSIEKSNQSANAFFHTSA